MTKIDRVEDLPGWFKLEKYRRCESFVAAEWFSCLSIRRGARAITKLAQKHGFSIAAFFSVSEDMPHPISMIRHDPLDWMAVKDLFWDKIGPDYVPTSPVRALAFEDLMFQRQSDIEGIHENSPDTLLADRWEWLSRHYSEYPEYMAGLPVGTMLDSMEPIVVDMRATDSVLKAAFATWLEDVRAKQSADATRKREAPAYKDWARYGLLPYLDLMTWAEETGTQIPHRVMAEAVGYIKGGDSFRKTVIPLAADLMRSLAPLEALAAIESVA